MGDIRQSLLEMAGHMARRSMDPSLLWTARDEIERLTARVERLQQQDTEAATYVETPICMRTDFTGDPPYVGWKGLGLALEEALDERDTLAARVAELRDEVVRLADRVQTAEAERDKARAAIQDIVDEYPVSAGTAKGMRPDECGYGSIFRARAALGEDW